MDGNEESVEEKPLSGLVRINTEDFRFPKSRVYNFLEKGVSVPRSRYWKTQLKSNTLAKKSEQPAQKKLPPTLKTKKLW
ncbi:hypothetical protein [Oryza sativa Japonica Group]|uniref:Uncharacterized protein n=1 Tax=Oryza sativa subsp. japonica TaxID=39947 RepID=Q5JJZ9_ORYSJ|nr:hypothetical protein [Oryza sativa Japonica Group]